MSMRLEAPFCPICRKRARYIVESVPVLAYISKIGNFFEYAGESNVMWDYQKPTSTTTTSGTKEVYVGCGDHEWTSPFEDTDA